MQMTGFWERPLCHRAPQLAVVDSAGGLTYHELSSLVDAAAAQLQSLGDRRLGFLLTSNTRGALVAYLACLRAQHVPLLLPADTRADLIADLCARYRPDWILGGPASNATSVLAGSTLPLELRPASEPEPALGSELALLLSTSGSTGSPKLVRLSYRNLQSNAESIGKYLALSPNERALTVLPMHYSYGLSVVNSHLAAGASLALRDVSVISAEFGQAIHDHAVTSIAGVPYTYQLLARTGFLNAQYPTLCTLTQAGGRMDEHLMEQFARHSQEHGRRFFVMYGQTEATARMAYVPPERLLNKLGSIGVAIPNGELALDPAEGELIYTGPNVMLGYAESRADLALGDVMHGRLPTGDLARCDDDGYYFVVGRRSRFIKLTGNRIALDEIERQLQSALGRPVMTSGRDERLVVWIEGDDEDFGPAAQRFLQSDLRIHRTLQRVRVVAALPALASGKRDYQALRADF